MNFNNCPICNLELFQFSDYTETFVCINKHVIGLYYNEATVRWDDIGFSISKNEVNFMYLQTNVESNFRLINGKIIKLFGVNVLNHAKIDFYPDLTDMSWSTFIQYIEYKAENAGIEIIKVDPRNTSKMCSKCKYIDKAQTLSERKYQCKSCGFAMDRDHNAALNIYGLGTSYSTLKDVKEALTL